MNEIDAETMRLLSVKQLEIESRNHYKSGDEEMGDYYKDLAERKRNGECPVIKDEFGNVLENHVNLTNKNIVFPNNVRI